jgi:hypothetical protein
MQRLSLRERPAGRVVMRQRWEQLLVQHWRYPAEPLQRRLPRGLTIDTCEGDAWIGIVPFFMRGVRIRGLPRLPTATDFLELNLRTYVRDEDGTPGVWFFSLDANSLLTVLGARTWFRLPYVYSRASSAGVGEQAGIDYRSRRVGRPEGTASQFVYREAGPRRMAQPGTLEFFLVERYLLFSQRFGRLCTGRVWHEPYQFADARVERWDDRLLGLNGFESPGRAPDHAVVSAGVEVDIFALQRADRVRAAPRA